MGDSFDDYLSSHYIVVDDGVPVGLTIGDSPAMSLTHFVYLAKRPTEDANREARMSVVPLSDVLTRKESGE